MIPTIHEVEEEHTYILAVDTEKFSEEEDDIQFIIFEQLLERFKKEEGLLKSVDNKDLITLLTGDGLIMAVKDNNNKYIPLKIALSILRIIQRIHRKDLRFGIHTGTARWIIMTDESRQLIGDAVNTTVRIMNSAEGNRILISDIYYKMVVSPNKHEFPGCNFDDRIEVTAKHNKNISVIRVGVP